MWQSYLAVAVGGAIGSVGRYWCAGVVAERIAGPMPWGTLAVNVVGSFVIGLFAVVTMPYGRFPAGQATRDLVMVGVLGGYTTFSAFSLQTLDLMRAGDWPRAGAYVGLSVALCLLGVWLGYLAGLALNQARGS